MAYSLHHRGAVMSSQITHAQSTNIHPLAHTLGTFSLISCSSCALFTVYHQPNHVTTSHPLKVISYQSAGVRSEMTQEPAKISMTQEPLLSILYMSTIALQSVISFLISRSLNRHHSSICPTPSSRHPSNITSVYPVPALHLL